MGEYASLTIWRKITEDTKPIYKDFLTMKQEEKPWEERHAYLEAEGIKPLDFGMLNFREINGEWYYSHLPMDLWLQQNEQQVCKYNMEKEWFLCFSYDEMTVTGEDVGVFQAITSADTAIERLKKTFIPNDLTFLGKKKKLMFWLIDNTKPGDYIELCSNYIYYSNDGEFNAEYVKKSMNERIKKIKETVNVPHWGKCPNKDKEA